MSSHVSFKTKIIEQMCFFLIIYTSEQNPKGEEHAKMNLPPKARANEGLLFGRAPAIIIEGNLRAPKAPST